MRLPFRYIEPTFFSGLFDDPVLYLRVRPQGRGLLFDCGQIHHLAKRVVRSVDALFITHAHMDHFMGVDTFVRSVHVAPKTIDLFGPPGIARRLECKLAAYDWNLSETYWCTFRVREIHEDRFVTYLLPGPEAFACRQVGEEMRASPVIYEGGHLTVRAALCDHKIPTLIYRVDEKPSFLIDEEALVREGLLQGPWLKKLKGQFSRGELGGHPLRVLGKGGEEILVEDTATLYSAIGQEQAPASLGYLTDIGATEGNLRQVKEMMQGVTLLLCECSYLAEDLDRARVSYHLCTADLNALVTELEPRFVLPMHLSKTYIHRSRQLYGELSTPEQTTLLRLPDHVPPRPLLPCEIPPLGEG